MSTKDSMIAAEIQDLASTIDEAVLAIRKHSKQEAAAKKSQLAPVLNFSVPEQAPPVVTVNVPEQHPPAVNIHVPKQSPPTVNVSPAPISPVINVERAEPVAYTVRITDRDVNGFISEFVIIPLEGEL